MIGTLMRERALTEGNFPSSAALAFSFIVVMFATYALLWGLLKLLTLLGQSAGDFTISSAARLRRLWPRTRRHHSLSRPVSYTVLAYLMSPVVVVFVFSFNEGSNVGLPWDGFTTEWYSKGVALSGFSKSLVTSLKVSGIAVLLAVLIGTPAAFGLRKLPSKLRPVASFISYLPYIVPGILLGVAVLAFASEGDLALGIPTTAILHTFLILPIIVLVIGARLQGMDSQLPEAARDLGASPAVVFRTVTLPLIFPAVLGAAMIGAAYSIDELLVTNFSIGNESTIPVWLYGQARRGFSPAINAIAVLLMLATLVMFAVAVFSILQASKSKS